MSGSATAQSLTQELYHYLNSTHKIQIVCLVNNNSVLMKKIVFPQQRILLAVVPEGKLEIYADKNGKKILQDIIYFQNSSITEAELELTAI